LIDIRPSRDMIFMEMAHVIRKRSTCSRGSVGAVAVMDNRILATGYNGAPPGAPHCTELGCLLEDNHHEAGCQRAVHCEANLIAWAARHGIALRGATLYCTHGPCLKCAQLILSAGFTQVVYGVPYRLPEGWRLLIDMGLEIHQFDPEYVQLLAERHAKAPPQARNRGRRRYRLSAKQRRLSIMEAQSDHTNPMA
jgi:dCMP deaminase